MRRPLTLALAIAVLATACSSGVSTTSTAAPQATVDIKRSKLDIAYSFIVDADVHNVSSKTVLEAGLNAVKDLVKQTNGKDGVAMPDFKDVTDPVNPDFVKFIQAAGQLALQNPGLSPDRIAEAVMNAFIRASPDCHTYYVNRRSEVSGTQVGAALPPGPRSPLDDEAGLESRMLAGNVGYVAWREFVRSGTYDITAEVRKRLEALVAQGAKAWLFDLRNNVGGDPPQTMASWFLKDGDKLMAIAVKNGAAGISVAKGELRLPEAYQLPMAILLNARSGSSPEVLTLGLKENKRATVVGSKSAGCLGAVNLVDLPDGTRMGVAVQEFVGAVTGARYNNVGIPPDVPADDATAIDVATKLLQDKIAGR